MLLSLYFFFISICILKKIIFRDERAWVSYHYASTVEKTVRDGGKFGLICLLFAGEITTIEGAPTTTEVTGGRGGGGGLSGGEIAGIVVGSVFGAVLLAAAAPAVMMKKREEENSYLGGFFVFVLFLFLFY